MIATAGADIVTPARMLRVTAEAGLEKAAAAVEDGYNDQRGKGILQMCQRNALKVPTVAVSLVFAGHPL